MQLAEPAVPATEAWKRTLYFILKYGEPSNPRGFVCIDLRNASISVEMMRPAVMCSARKLSQKFLAGEAAWILSGDDSVAGIAPYNEHIKKFSDDGTRFFGAYGPKIVGQLQYVVDKLAADPHTRQAGLTIWRENPPETKDYPCTIAMWFRRRGWWIDSHVFMRSSDAWLGLPYDVFNFSMVAATVCAMLNKPLVAACTGPEDSCQLVLPGTLHLTMASSHLYGQHFKQAEEIVYGLSVPDSSCQPIPLQFLTDPAVLLGRLRAAREDTSARFWLET